MKGTKKKEKGTSNHERAYILANLDKKLPWEQLEDAVANLNMEDGDEEKAQL